MRSPLRDLLSALALVLVSIAMPQSAHAEPVVAGEEHCVINVRTNDVLNLRAQPGAQSAALSGLRYGQCGILVTGACHGE